MAMSTAQKAAFPSKKKGKKNKPKIKANFGGASQ